MLTGGKTYVISLPLDWIKKFGIKKGKEIDISENEGNLVLSQNSGVALTTKIEIDITPYERILGRTLSAIYKNGYSEVVLKSENKALLKKVEAYFNHYFIGMESVNIEKNRCVLKQIAPASEEEFDNLFRKMLLALISMGSNVIEGLKTRDGDLLREAIEQDKVNNNSIALCKHILITKKIGKNRNALYLYCLCESLQNFADEHKFIASYSLNEKLRLKEEIFFYEKLQELFNKWYELFYKYDATEMTELTIQIKEFRGSLYSQFNKKLDQKVLYSLMRIADILHEMLSFRLSMAL